jgi:hypothetical protein
MEITREYQLANNEHGPIPPEFVHARRRQLGEFPTKIEQKERDLRRDVEGVREELRRIKGKGVDREMHPNYTTTTTPHPLTNLAAKNSSTCTLWPTLYEEVHHQATYRTNPQQIVPQAAPQSSTSRGEYGGDKLAAKMTRTLDSGIDLADANTFVVGKDCDHGFELQSLPPVHTSGSRYKPKDRIPATKYEHPRDSSVNPYSPYEFDEDRKIVPRAKTRDLLAPLAPLSPLAPMTSNKPTHRPRRADSPTADRFFDPADPEPSDRHQKRAPPTLASPFNPTARSTRKVGDVRESSRLPVPRPPPPAKTRSSAAGRQTSDTGRDKPKRRSPPPPRGRPAPGGGRKSDRKPSGNFI